jgi:hypothetical protein
MREAASQIGHHRSGAAAREYYGTMAEEINAACAAGKLDCLPPHASLIPPYWPQRLGAIWHSFWHGAKTVARFGAYPDSSEQLVEQAGRPDLLPLLQYVGHPDRLAGVQIKQQDALDLLDILSTLSSHASFPNSIGSPEQLALFRDLTRDTLNPVAGAAVDLPLQAASDRFKQAWIKRWAHLYQALLPPLTLLALALYGWNLLRRPLHPLTVIQTALLGAIAARLLILAVIDATAFMALSLQYLSPLFPLLLLFNGLALASRSGTK